MTGGLKGLLSSALLSQPPDSWTSAGFFVFFFFAVFCLASSGYQQVSSRDGTPFSSYVTPLIFLKIWFLTSLLLTSG